MIKRTQLEICKNIFEHLFLSPQLTPTELRNKTGLGADSVSGWIELITYIQRQPDLQIINRGKRRALTLKKEALSLPIDKNEIIAGAKLLKLLLEMPPTELKAKINQLKSIHK